MIVDLKDKVLIKMKLFMFNVYSIKYHVITDYDVIFIDFIVLYS